MFSGYIFTLTAGRTGTAWLAKFLSANLNTPAIHEPLGIDDFGVSMPDIRIMRAFNDRGGDEIVTNFWTNKLNTIGKLPKYIETNHTLGKCGLIEYLSQSPICEKSRVFLIKRNLVDQCVSYMNRFDFCNVTIEWQWYLSPRYNNIIVDPTQFLTIGLLGRALWYTYEMECREYYYKARYGDKINFIECTMEDMVTQSGANSLLAQLGEKKPAILPPRENANNAKKDVKLAYQIKSMVNAINLDPAKLVAEYLASGRTLSNGKAP